MTVLSSYNAFEGRLWERGPIHNILAYQGAIATHTGKALSEALLLGISGGLVAGYFTFEYQGHLPWLHFITINTFDPMDTLLARLGIKPEVRQTSTPEKGEQNLLAVLEGGRPAMVWADTMALPYNNTKLASGTWGMMPVVVYGYEPDAVWLADRAKVPLMVTPQEFQAARGQKYRVAALPHPDLSQLPQAVEAGIRQCLAAFLEPAPLKPLQGKFGLDGFTRWSDLLTMKGAKGWAKQYPPGERLLSVLMTGYKYMHLWGTGGHGGRSMYADFLDEAAAILGRPQLREAAQRYRIAVKHWEEVLASLLPDDVPPLGEIRQLLQHDSHLFREQGAAALPERVAVSDRLAVLRQQASQEFPLDEVGAAHLRERLREHVEAVRASEESALQVLQQAMA